MPSITLASRTFDANEQVLFARLTGDFNPIHMDPIAARRTQAGATVVHGIHAILWALDKLVETGAITEQIDSLKVQFTSFIHVGSRVELKLLSREEKSIRAEISIGRLRIAILIVTFGTRRRIGDIEPLNIAPRISPAGCPAKFDRFEEMANLRGSMDSMGPADGIQRHFPYASSATGKSRVTGIALLSTLVGMICPGLHSLFGGFEVELTDDLQNQDRIGFQVTETDDRFRMVRMNVFGAGIRGSVQALLRWPPISQASLSTIMSVVSPTEFVGSTALIIGGSRGLGALTAKVLAAGGGRVIVTYATGHDDAEALAGEIRSQTATDICRTFRYNIYEEAAPQLSNLKTDVTHLYYFATGKIARQKDSSFETSLFDEFIQMYVKGFYHCCVFFGDHGSSPLTAFYPSSVFVVTNPPDMLEYSMAKMVGEMLCSSINRTDGRVHTVVSRLPPLLTDQTATVIPMERNDPLKVMLPVVRNVQAHGLPHKTRAPVP